MRGRIAARLLVVITLTVACAFAVPAFAYADAEAAPGGHAPNDTQGGTLLVGSEANGGNRQNVVPATDRRIASPSLKYRSRVIGKKWAKWASAGKTSGKPGKGKYVDRFKVKKAHGLSLRYRVSAKGKWQKWKKAGSAAGKAGKPVNAVKIQLTGAAANKFDVAYRVYTHGSGWLPWAVNGAVAGKKNKSVKVEALQVKLVQKRTIQAVPNGVYFITSANNPSAALAAGGSLGKVAFNKSAMGQRYVVRNQHGAITIQSVSTGRYVCDGGGSVVLKPYAALSASACEWKLYWSSGFYMINAKTGKRLSLSGNSTALTASGSAWAFSPTDIIPAGGTFSVYNCKSSAILDVKGESWKNKANVQVYKAKRFNGSQVFKFKRAGASTYRLINVSSDKGVEVSGSTVRQNKSKNKASQKWHVTLDGQGRFVFTNKATARVLSAGGAAKSGSNALVAVDSGAVTQRWAVRAATYKARGVSGDKVLDRALAKINKKHKSLRAGFNYVVGFPYRDGARYWGGANVLSNNKTRSLAKDMVSHHSGNCYRFAALFCWIAKSKGYVARVRSGWVPAASGGRAPHGWVEIKVKGSWRVCDPELAHAMPGHRWYMVSYGGAPISYHFW